MSQDAPKKGGIWGSGITRDQLLQKISLLAMTGGVREGLREQRLIPSLCTGHVLTIEQEAEIANNLAFLCRRRHDPRTVAAVAIEEDNDGQGMVVRLCVNGNILTDTQEALDEICRFLQDISQQRISSSDGGSAPTNSENSEAYDIDRFLETVVWLCSSRLSARLKLARKYKVASSSIMQLRQALQKLSPAQINTEVSEKLETLINLYCTLKRESKCPNFHEMLKEIVKISYHLMLSAEFRRALDSIRTSDANTISSSQHSAGFYREAKKVQKFQKIGVHTFQIEVPQQVRDNAKLGSSIPLIRYAGTALTSCYGDSETKADRALISRVNGTRSGIKVHAEIKLLMFYELHPETTKPRVIAANKSSCYLCDLFFKIHGVFQFPSTFGMLTERWVLPDWCLITSDRSHHMGDTLTQFDRALNAQITSPLRCRQRKPDPLQSLIARSATWSASHDTSTPTSVVPARSSIISYASSVLQILSPAKLTVGKHIWVRVSGGELSLTVDFHKSFAVVYIEEAVEACTGDSFWAKLTLTSLQDLEPRGRCKHLIRLDDLAKGASTSLEGKSGNSETVLQMIWNGMALSMTVCAKR